MEAMLLKPGYKESPVSPTRIWKPCYRKLDLEAMLQKLGYGSPVTETRLWKPHYKNYAIMKAVLQKLGYSSIVTKTWLWKSVQKLRCESYVTETLTAMLEKLSF